MLSHGSDEECRTFMVPDITAMAGSCHILEPNELSWVSFYDGIVNRIFHLQCHEIQGRAFNPIQCKR